jgi:nucleoside-diphosphate-sugar epimerase
MIVFVAGAAGAIGRRLVPMLVERGHAVHGTTRSPEKADALRAAGAVPVVIDVFDAAALRAAVVGAEPDVVVHELTALPEVLDPRRMERLFEETNRLRTEVADTLLAAATAAGARRFVAQSFAGWPFARLGGPVKTEDDSLDPEPPPPLRPALEAIERLEHSVIGAAELEGVVLRYGGFYGPGTSLAPGTKQVELIRKRRFPILGEGRGIWSFVHIDDAAAATVAAVEHGARGIYQIVDDEPARVAEWLPALAAAAGAKPPRRLPLWLGRLAAGEVAVVLLDQVRGASNEKAKRELGWRPQYPSWREGFPAALR